MTFLDYPGHLVATMVLLLLTGATFLAFRSGELRTTERKRYRWVLMLLQYAAVLVLLLISWNPSTWHTTDVYKRNAVLAAFDTSRSMSIADDRQLTRLDKALDRFATHFGPHQGTSPEYRVYGFDRAAYHCGSPDLLRRWGAQTDVQAVCSLLAQTIVPQTAGTESRTPTDPEADITGAIVFTDGQGQEKDPRAYPSLLRDAPPVLLVGVGSKKPHVDVAVTSISAPARVWVDTAYTVTVAVTRSGLIADPVIVELLRDGQLVGTRSLDPEAGSASARHADAVGRAVSTPEATVEFTLPAQRLGTHVLTARAKPHRQEVNAANNARDAIVEVTQERTLKVLLYSQWATFDIGKIRQALAWDRRIHLDLGFDVIKDPALSDGAGRGSGYVKLPRDKEEFFEYDVIVLGPCDLSGLTRAQLDGLYSFVADRGGGLMLLPGPAVTSLAAWSDERGNALLPVVLDDRDARLWPPQPDAIDVTFEGRVSRVFSPNAFEDPDQRLSAYYDIARVKPASTTLVAVQGMPLATAHRLGRGRVCLLNASKLFTLYREDRQGGRLSELLSGLVVYLARTPSRGAGVELFVARTADDPRRVAFSAYVLDEAFQPVHQANVLLTVRDHVVGMTPVGQGRYRAEIEQGLSESVVATVQAESNGVFLGERTIATSLPPVRDEMSHVALDEGFLKALASRLGAEYVHIDDLDDRAADAFVARRQVGSTQTVGSTWPRWPLLLTLCLLLSVTWFLRRAIGLV